MNRLQFFRNLALGVVAVPAAVKWMGAVPTCAPTPLKYVISKPLPMSGRYTPQEFADAIAARLTLTP